MLNAQGEEIDLLTQELEKVGHADPSNVTEDPIRERTASLALTIASDSGVEHEKLLAQHQALHNLSNSSKLTSDSPANSGRTTPALTKKDRHHLLRSVTISASSSLTNEGSSSKNDSLT
jgi:hypothetical protein